MYWDILVTKDTYDTHMQASKLEKYVLTQAAESRFDSRLANEFASIVGLELTRIQFGLRLNMYPILRVPWDKADHPKLELECKFYSVLAQALLMDPEKGATLTRDNVKLADVAAAWEPGTALGDHVLSGEAPAIKGGTKLYTFVDQGDGHAKEAGNHTMEAEEEDDVDDRAGAGGTPAPGSDSSNRPKRKRAARLDGSSESDFEPDDTPTQPRKKTAGAFKGTLATPTKPRYKDQSESSTRLNQSVQKKAAKKKI